MCKDCGKHSREEFKMNTSESEFEVMESPPEKVRGLFREIFDSELALWTVYLSGLWTYLWSSKKRICLFNIFVLLPCSLAAIFFLSWILAVTITVGRVLFGNPEAANNSAVSWVVKRLPHAEKPEIQRRRSMRGTHPTRRSFRGTKSSHSNPKPHQNGLAPKHTNGFTQKHTNGFEQKHTNGLATNGQKEKVMSALTEDNSEKPTNHRHRHLKVANGYFWQRVCPAPAYYEQITHHTEFCARA